MDQQTSPKQKNGFTYDSSIPSGENYDKAEFRLWTPKKPDTLKGILVAIGGRDSRPWIDQTSWKKFTKNLNLEVRASYWHDIALRHNLALLGCNITDKPHEDMDALGESSLDEYCNVRMGSGQALLDAVAELSELSDHPELSQSPLAFCGLSAGGQFSYEFACWKPERTITFVLNKGGIYYTALALLAARNVPGILYIGEKDSPFRNNIINGIFSINRRAYALWALTVEPNVAHEVARSLMMSEIWLDEVVPLRLPVKLGGPLRPLSIQSGYLGDLKTHSYIPYDEEKAKDEPTAWLPTEKVARAWQAVMTGKRL